MPAQYDAMGNYTGDFEDVQYAGTPPSQEQIQSDAAASDQGGGGYTSASPQSFRESENASMDSLANSQAAENNYGDFTYGSSALVSQDSSKNNGSSSDTTTGNNEQVGSGSSTSSNNSSSGSSESNNSENIGRESSYTSGSNSNFGNMFGSGFRSGAQSVGRILAGMGETAVAPGSSGQGYNPEKYSSGRKNPLNQYASLNCLFTLACITTAQQNSGNFNPAQLRNIVCRTQGDWHSNWKEDNHVKVPGFGSYDFIIDDLIIATIPAMNPATGNAFATKITFKVTEPYSLGLFFLALQEGAKSSGYSNFREASYLLMIEFQGYRDGGAPFVDHSLTRLIPIKFVTIKLRASMSGSAYECEAIPYNEVAFRDPFSKSTTDIVVSGDTVKSALSSGGESLKAALQKQAQGTKGFDAVDKIDIEFPVSWNVVPDTGNAISASTIYKDYNDAGQVKFPANNAIFDKVKQIYNNSSVKITKEKNFQFSQGTKIQDMISAIVMRSDFIVKQLLGTNGAGSILMDPKGMIDWFRIETRVIDGKDSATQGRQVRTMKFRVVPYKVHVSRFLPPNAKAPGYQALNQSVIRVYEYLYTGQNTDIISLDLEFNMAFYAALPVDASNRTGSDNSQLVMDGNGKPLRVDYDSLPVGGDTRDGNRSSAAVGDDAIPKNIGTGSNDSKTIQGKTLEALLTQPGEMVELQMQVRGDPYYLPSSGMGNIIKKPAAGAAGYNMLEDGSMNYQSGETDIVIVIRTPIDLNPKTGLYEFSKTVDELSGLFMITEVESKFNHNKFTQTIKCFRREAQLGSGSGIKNVLF